MEKKNTWETYSSKQLKELEKINAQYRDFLDNGKTERECIDTIVNTIEKSGYRELESLIKEGAALKTVVDTVHQLVHVAHRVDSLVHADRILRILIKTGRHREG